ncbi:MULTISPECIES: class I SAM-dependent methyltransferase, partial [unclassified Moorena]|uniref:class I SAM-dependent methyltransferase n=1 Tax=unclassified Moorena TaxID=2683338 RepID=UPI0013FEA2CF
MTNQNQWNADDYANNSSAQLNWAKELIKKLSLMGNETLLDIGCGDGKITAKFASIINNGSVLGIDSSQTMVELARKTFRKHSGDGVDKKGRMSSSVEPWKSNRQLSQIALKLWNCCPNQF